MQRIKVVSLHNTISRAARDAHLTYDAATGIWDSIMQIDVAVASCVARVVRRDINAVFVQVTYAGRTVRARN